jgi:hypothetical protein
MAFPHSNNAEGGTDTVTVTTGNSGGGSGDAWDSVTIGGTGTLIFDSSQKAHGSLAYKGVNEAGNVLLLLWSTSLANYTESWGRMYVRGTTSVSHYLFELINSSSQTCAVVRLTSTGKVAVQDADGGETVGTTTVPTNAWYRIEFHYIAGTGTSGTIEAKLFTDLESTTPTETITRASVNTKASGDWIRTGNSDGTPGSGTWWLDDITVNTTGYPGPAVTTPDPTATSFPRRGMALAS